jgi:hypothetical protein
VPVLEQVRLDEAVWQARADAHEARVDDLVGDHLGRRRRGVSHPVHDFLFTYYSFRPAQLRRWLPGFGVVCLTTRGGASSARPAPAEVTAADVMERRDLIAGTHALLAATAARPAHLGCFGLHEWAMVYRSDEVRHRAYPLRLGHRGTDEVVESHRIACSHFDAYRFFTEPARPLNALSPSAHDRPAFEQPGCLHAGMDLYKHACRLARLIPSELTTDCFELAWELRILDMRAAPYDFSGLRFDRTGEEWTPIRIETPEGKREYVEAQKRFAERSRVLRLRLVAECERILAVCH